MRSTSADSKQTLKENDMSEFQNTTETEAAQTEIDAAQAVEDVLDEAEQNVPLTVEDVIDSILSDFDDARTFSPYKVADFVNAVLEVLEVQKNGKEYRVRPQMLYNYAGNGMLVKGVKDSKMKVTKEQVRTFVVAFVKRAQNNN